MDVMVQASVEAQIFGANVMGMVSQEKTGNTTTTTFLVMPSEVDENKPFGVKEIVAEINNTIYKIENNTEEISGSAPEKVSAKSVNDALEIVGLRGATLTFMQTYIYYKKIKITPEGESNVETEQSAKMEYAIGIHVRGGAPKADDFKFLDIKEAYINIWNTERQKVLERMKIWTEAQLEEK